MFLFTNITPPQGQFLTFSEGTDTNFGDYCCVPGHMLHSIVWHVVGSLRSNAILEFEDIYTYENYQVTTFLP